MRATFRERASEGGARTGTVTTARGSFTTPCFMPVGTRGAVRHLSSADLESLGAEVVLANTYHLMLRPGADVIGELGGLHRFTDWSGFLLTDSGGYQIYSLAPEIDDEGARFKSVYDGSSHSLTPETAVETQATLAADIQMVLDVCPPSTAETSILSEAVERTARWAKRGRHAFTSHADASEWQCQFGIVQGGADEKLRVESAERTLDVGFDGYAIGGLSVGETRTEMLPALDACMELLPTDQPRYFMGLGDPIGIVESVARGVDMFDCVLPTRLGRHGTVLTDSGRYNLSRAELATSDDPLDPSFPDSPAAAWSRGYLRHLLNTGEPTGPRLVTLHNLAWLFRFMGRIREAIAADAFEALRTEVHEIWADGGRIESVSHR